VKPVREEGVEGDIIYLPVGHYNLFTSAVRDREAWCATVQGVTNNPTKLGD